jgi:hypothetical protein
MLGLESHKDQARFSTPGLDSTAPAPRRFRSESMASCRFSSFSVFKACCFPGETHNPLIISAYSLAIQGFDSPRLHFLIFNGLRIFCNGLRAPLSC